MVSATIDFKEFADLLPRLEKALNGGIIKAVDSQAKLLIRNGNSASLLSLTPPRGLDEGKDVGYWAVARDANRVFASRGTINTILSRARKKAVFARYIKNNELEKAKELLNGQTQASVEVKGYTRNGKQVRPYRQTRSVSNLGDNRLGHIESIAPTPDESMLKQRRGSRYKVGRKQWSQVVLRGNSLKNLVDKLQKRVGTMKAGWRFAAKALGVSLPPYVNSATTKTNGSFNANSPGPASYTIEMTNTTPRVDKLLTQSAVDFLVGLRLNNLTAFLEKSAAEAAARTK
jgi:hypothetical protein